MTNPPCSDPPWLEEALKIACEVGFGGGSWSQIARAVLAFAACQPREWQLMETAPRDGTKILLLGCGGEIEVGYWNPNGDSWADENGTPCDAGHGTIQVTGSWFAGGGWFQPNEVHGWLPLPTARNTP